MPSITDIVGSHSAAIRKITDSILRGQGQLMGAMAALINELRSTPKSITQEIDAIPGRRIEYSLSGGIAFDATQNGLRGQPVTLQVSQDGPFVATHYPLVTWRPNAPATATNFGKWRPVASWPLPTQQVTSDFIDLSFELIDGGAQRNFQSAARGPMFSRPDALEPLPVPTLFAPNATLQFFPTYNRIDFNTGGTATTGGFLQVDIPGYRIVNL